MWKSEQHDNSFRAALFGLAINRLERGVKHYLLFYEVADGYLVRRGGHA